MRRANSVPKFRDARMCVIKTLRRSRCKPGRHLSKLDSNFASLNDIVERMLPRQANWTVVRMGFMKPA
jgi:hypothetical protein